MTESHGTCPCCQRPATEKCPQCEGFFCDIHVSTRRMHVESSACKNEPLVSPSDFVPSEADISCIKAVMNGLAVGGVWAYKSIPMVFQKKDEKTLVLVAAYMEHLFPSLTSEIERTKKVLLAAGYVFEDGRATP